MQDEFGEAVIEVPDLATADSSPRTVFQRIRLQDPVDVCAGMTAREIQGHLQEIYGREISQSLFSKVTDAVIEEVKAWPLGWNR